MSYKSDLPSTKYVSATSSFCPTFLKSTGLESKLRTPNFFGETTTTTSNVVNLGPDEVEQIGTF
ncbi:MAG: hypothetical protein FWC00_01410 [Firmicutes bacterium]|nr:hypothetical protein [Bacillota bacterium]